MFTVLVSEQEFIGRWRYGIPLSQNSAEPQNSSKAVAHHNDIQNSDFVRILSGAGKTITRSDCSDCLT